MRHRPSLCQGGLRPAETCLDTPENIARAVLTTPPKAKKDWRYLKPAR